MSVLTMRCRRDPDGRIIEKTETIHGESVKWKYNYDQEGRLTEAHIDGRLVCQCWYDKEGRRIQDYLPATAASNFRKYKYTQDNRLMMAGNNTYTHDENGFRSIWSNKGVYTLYEYSPDYRLLKMEIEDQDHVVDYEHDENGQRIGKFVNGELVEAYAWLDFVRLAGFYDGRNTYEFEYGKGARLPHAISRKQGIIATLHYDQVGSLRAVADMDGNVIRKITYDPFGGIIEDTNPGLRIPIGFAGGLHDRDLGFVRFGWRDYDVNTGRWTGPDPIGDKGGDPDWYGYCLDDPINLVDPLGLKHLGGNRYSTGADQQRAVKEDNQRLGRGYKVYRNQTYLTHRPDTGMEWQNGYAKGGYQDFDSERSLDPNQQRYSAMGQSDARAKAKAEEEETKRAMAQADAQKKENEAARRQYFEETEKKKRAALAAMEDDGKSEDSKATSLENSPPTPTVNDKKTQKPEQTLVTEPKPPQTKQVAPPQLKPTQAPKPNLTTQFKANVKKNGLATEDLYFPPGPVDWGAAWDRFADGMDQLATKAPAGIAKALSKTGDFLLNNEDMHKGVEFGAKAAGVVSKEVAKRTAITVAIEFADYFGFKYAKQNKTLKAIAKRIDETPAGWLTKESVKNIVKDSFDLEGHKLSAQEIGNELEALKANIYEPSANKE